VSSSGSESGEPQTEPSINEKIVHCIPLCTVPLLSYSYDSYYHVLLALDDLSIATLEGAAGKVVVR
jgi:hypothetical protein